MFVDVCVCGWVGEGVGVLCVAWGEVWAKECVCVWVCVCVGEGVLNVWVGEGVCVCVCVCA